MLSQERIKYRGIKPTDLSVEQPTKFEFIINLKAAKQIGLTPPNVLAGVDRVIK
jgi:putative tryptophan/tyrosine transport system substrate-binding protein